MKIVSVLNHKGGVGKTTFSGSVAQALSLIGFRVLAIDNDSQHNLSSLLGTGVKNPSLHDVYTSSPETAATQLLRSVRKTELPNLHILTASSDLCDSDITDLNILKSVFAHCKLDRFYDFVIIDNAPGMDRLQAAAINASDEIFVPTELRQFAIDGLAEMEATLSSRYPDAAKITRIIPNFYRNTRRHDTFIAALNKMFPDRVTETVIPLDNVFDEVVTEGKILFLHRLYSKGAAYYLKLVHELFNLNEDSIREQVTVHRKERLADEARKRLAAQREKGKVFTNVN